MGTAQPAEQQGPPWTETETETHGSHGARSRSTHWRTDNHNTELRSGGAKLVRKAWHTQTETKTQGPGTTVSQHSKGGEPPKRRARPQLPVVPKPKRCHRQENMRRQGGHMQRQRLRGRAPQFLNTARGESPPSGEHAHSCPWRPNPRGVTGKRTRGGRGNQEMQDITAQRPAAVRPPACPQPWRRSLQGPQRPQRATQAAAPPAPMQNPAG